MTKYKIIAHTPVGIFESEVMEENIRDDAAPHSDAQMFQFPLKDNSDNHLSARFMEDTIKNSVFKYIILEEEDG